MPSIHIIYDPNNKVSSCTQEWFAMTKAAGIVMTLPEGFEFDEGIELRTVVEEAAMLLLKQIKS